MPRYRPDLCRRCYRPLGPGTVQERAEQGLLVATCEPCRARENELLAQRTPEQRAARRAQQREAMCRLKERRRAEAAGR